MKPKLIAKFTVNGRVLVSQEQWDNPARTILSVFNQKGQRAETIHGRTNMGGVHRENLADSKAKAIANRDAICKELFGENYIPFEEMR